MGEVVRVPVCPGRPRLLDGLDARFVEACIERQLDTSLQELQTHFLEATGVHASTTTIWRTLKRLGYTMKLITVPAIEQNEYERIRFKMHIGEHYEASQLVFVDESHFNWITLRRSYAWAPCGDRASCREFFVRGARYSILPALSLDGIVHTEVYNHVVTGDNFRLFIAGLLERMQPWPLPNSVIIMDNETIHKVEGIQEMVEECGMHLIYLPVYSPDLNPIEEAFSSIKAWLRANHDYVNGGLEGAGGDPYAVIWEAVHSVTPEGAYGWYQHAEYIA